MTIDETRPHIARIYDYVLGGTHNHEADRQAARIMMDRMPSYPRWARQNRDFLARVGQRWAAEGRARVLDLGSGLPTQGHFNTHLPGARILFADIDPLTVAQGRQILGESDDMAYVEVDIRDPAALLAHAEAFFGAERRLAIGLIGIAYFLSDDQVRALLRSLHAFSAPGSALALSFPAVPDGRLTEEERAINRELEQVARISFFHRTPEEIRALVEPWRMTSVEPLADAPLGESRDPLGRMVVYGAFAEHG